jgi:shikimate kinase
VLFASLHALSAWLSVKSLAFVKAHQHETDDFGDDIIITHGGGPRSALALLHRSACAIHLLRSAMRTYRELRNDESLGRRQKQRRRRRRISSKKRKSTVKVLDWVFLRNTQTNAHDAKSTLERGERNCIA